MYLHCRARANIATALTIPTTTGAGKFETSLPRRKNAATIWRTPAKATA